VLLKSSDFIVNDLSAESVFEGCTSVNITDNSNDDNDDKDQDRDRVSYKLELVLRKWFAIDPSREMRAFVREGVLIGAFVSFRFVSNKYKFCGFILIFAKGQVYRSVVIRTITSF
jgi:hypothetical protein